jgi:type IV pilus assembly protein PilE
MTPKKPQQQGFTLIELMITVAIVAILSAIAIPSYQSYVIKSRRADIQTVMLDIQLRQEKWRSTHTTYGTLADLGITSPTTYYSISITRTPDLTSGSPTGTEYAITVTAVAGTTQAKDTGCTTMSITQASAKAQPNCWKT